MLTRPERLIAVAAGGVLVVGLVSTSYAGPPAVAAKAADVTTPTTAPAPTTAPTMGPVAPTPTLQPKPAPVQAPAVPGALPAMAAAPTVPQSGCPAPVQHPSSWTPKPLGAPAVADAALPKTLPRRAKATDLSAVTGKGIWVTNWPKDTVDVKGVVAKAKAAGLTSIWVRTGGSRQGYYGNRVLPALVPAAHRAGLKVVAWDFPFLSDPVSDVVRAHKALAAGIDAFAPDIETAAEGTHASSRRVSLYLSLVRSVAGNRPIAATVPRPTPKRLTSFPYAAFAPYADLFVPMVYWSCNEPGLLVQQSLQRLGRWLPVAPVGQAYDMRTDGGRGGLPTRAETWRFLDSARRGGAVGASLWTIETIGAGQWSALKAYPWLGR
ncbi:MAG: N-acetylmuramoyl-L-alanine amidase [Frankiales bacterium]|nr:N-acetylmuramoyl-L-alanine amidase [Frankiales bacterium]